MRTTLSRLVTVIAAFGTSCAIESATEPVATSAQELNNPRACFVNAGQPDPSNPNSRRFDSSCSTPSPGSYIVFRTWDFGDGTSAFTGGTLTDHVFPFTNSCYKVQLTVWDINGMNAFVAHNEIFCAVGPCVPVCPP